MANDNEVMQMNVPALKFCSRLVNAVVQLRQELGRAYDALGMGGWEGYDYAEKVDQLLEEADAFVEDSDG